MNVQAEMSPPSEPVEITNRMTRPVVARASILIVVDLGPRGADRKMVAPELVRWRRAS